MHYHLSKGMKGPSIKWSNKKDVMKHFDESIIEDLAS